MKLNSSDLLTKMQDANSVSETLSFAMDNATTAGNVAEVDSNLLQHNAKQAIPGNQMLMVLKQSNDAESATDSNGEFDIQKTTPRIPRKRDLINLKSNLSPKYIGYVNANMPTAGGTVGDDTKRATRRRNQQEPSPSLKLNESSAPSPVSTTTSNCGNAAAIVTPPSLGTPKIFMSSSGGAGSSSSYLSPIDKLLIKNGANSPNSTGFEADAEDVSIDAGAVVQRPRKQLKRKLKRGPKPKAIDLKQNDEAEEEAVETTVATPIEEAIQKKEEAVTEEDKVVIKQEMLGSEIQSEVNGIDEIEVKVESVEEHVESVELDMGIQMEMVTPASISETDSIKSPPDLMEPPNRSGDQSMKSPSSVSIDSAKGSSIVNEIGWSTYQIGDLCWGKLFAYCYWPCMVCPDEFNQIVGNTNAQQRRSTDSGTGNVLSVQVHVRFFADNGRHNWIKSENLMPFVGLKAYEDLRDEVRLKYGAKSAKYRQMVAKQNKLLVWRQAIEEANQVSDVPYEQRMKKFFEIHERNLSLSKGKRKHNKLLTHHDTSDVGSSIYDSSEHLNVKAITTTEQLQAGKRERSTTPFSPAFSPVKNNRDKRVKRRKLSNDEEEHVGTMVEQKPLSANVEDFSNPEYCALLDAIREYVMVDHSEKAEKALRAVVGNIWSLKYIQERDMERELIVNGELELEQLGSARLEMDRNRGRGVATVKRLSTRLKRMMLQRSLTPAPAPAAVTPEPSTASRVVAEPKKSKKPVGLPIEQVIKDILELDRKYLFRGLSREPICKYCYEPGGDLARCAQSCNKWFHAKCLEQPGNTITAKMSSGRKASKSKSVEPPVIRSTEEAANTPHITGDVSDLQPEKTALICHECATGKLELCCICSEDQLPTPTEESSTSAVSRVPTELISCSHPMCTNKFHAACSKKSPQANISNSAMRCPMHVCHTCTSTDTGSKYQQLASSKLIKCVKCAGTYHQESCCIPAGSRMLTTTQLICPRHISYKGDNQLNVQWCCICVRGGVLICCETCPIAVHAHCRKVPIESNEVYICEECESGRLPLYGEIVWAKFNNYRWWPSIILPPTEIPKNILKKPHGESEFVVRFFGTNDHGWISRRRVHLYVDGDTGDGYKNNSQLYQRYKAGVEEATHYHKILQEKRHEQAATIESGSKLHPPPYIKIKANKAVPPLRFVSNAEDVNVCECQADSPHPCGPESGCLNRILYHECNPQYCRAGSKCENQLFELRKSPRMEVVYMNERGFGLVCREAICEGDFIIEYVGEVINHAEFQRRMAQKTTDRDENYYFLGVEKDFIIDAGPKGNVARFMNHSCEPNCATQKWIVDGINRVGIFAIKDIKENTELTFNYLWDDLINNDKKACFCGAKRCSGEIGGKLKEEESKEISKAITNKGKSGNKKFKKLPKSIKIRVKPARTAASSADVKKKAKGTKYVAEKSDKLDMVETVETPQLPID